MAESKSTGIPLTNSAIANALDQVAELLEAQQANAFRIAAYRKGAETIRSLDRSICDILQHEGHEGLVRLLGIGDSLAKQTAQLCETGRLPMLERLRDGHVVESLFATVSGIGPELAARIHEQLGIETLAELEAAADDGSLETVPGFGRKRVQAVREVLAGRFRGRSSTSRRSSETPSDVPPVAELLDADAEYRRKAEADQLIRIAPRRFNPTKTAWLPILHTSRGPRHYTALYSNTARAHELGTTHDWVVIYRDDQTDGRWTVITSRFSDLKGRRIVRGRETECRQYYEQQSRGAISESIVDSPPSADTPVPNRSGART